MDLCLEQANIFSAIMGMFGTNALDAVSDYEKHRDSFTAQQRFPDLGRRGTRKPQQLEVTQQQNRDQRRPDLDLQRVRRGAHEGPAGTEVVDGRGESAPVTHADRQDEPWRRSADVYCGLSQGAKRGLGQS